MSSVLKHLLSNSETLGSNPSTKNKKTIKKSKKTKQKDNNKKELLSFAEFVSEKWNENTVYGLGLHVMSFETTTEILKVRNYYCLYFKS